MNLNAHPRFSAATPQVVAAIHTARGLALAQRLRPGSVDFLEIRLDAWAGSAEDWARLEKALPKLAFPLIATARDPREGGTGELAWARREELLRGALAWAKVIDLELRNAQKAAALREAARAKGVAVMLSAHDFRRMPTLAALQKMTAQARAAGADVFKFAGMASHAGDLATLLRWVAAEKRIPLAAMGMGALGRISRLTLGRAGSVLNYGFLDAANVPGQWSARLLKQRLAELAEA